MATLKGEVRGLRLLSFSGVPDGGEVQPNPDSRKMDDLIGSGELDISLSRNGEETSFGLAIVAGNGWAEMMAAAE